MDVCMNVGVYIIYRCRGVSVPVCTVYRCVCTVYRCMCTSAHVYAVYGCGCVSVGAHMSE